MKFFEQHFTTHHLLHAPHKWFFALFISPIHFAEMHYKKRYHLQFAHARKLFLFDISLLLSSLAILSAGIFWWTYDPTITDLVYVSITPSKMRIISGEEVTYTINYKNESEVAIQNTKLILRLPHGFVFSQAEPSTAFDKTSQTFSLSELKPQDAGAVSITGLFYGTSDKETPLQAILEYNQTGVERREKKISPHIIIARGSLLKTRITVPESIIDKTRIPLSIEIENTGDVEFPLVNIPLILPLGLTLGDIKTTTGTIQEKNWLIGTLQPKSKEKLEADILTDFTGLVQEKNKTLLITPSVTINNTPVDQETNQSIFSIAYPHLSLTTQWEHNIISLSPNETGRVVLNIINDSNVTLYNGHIEIPLQNTIINTDQMTRLNSGSIANNNVVLTSPNYPQLSNLEPGKSTTIVIHIPIRSAPQGGNDITLSISPHVSATVADTTSLYSIATETSRISIGTQLTMQAEARYYTNEGDQLGRGPLPPEVGKETRYGIITSIFNSTSGINDLVYTAKLPDYVRWTGVTSVSHGSQLTYNAQTRTVSWRLPSLPAYNTAQVYFELGLTPTENQRGTSPILVQNISLAGSDSFIKKDLTRSLGSVDISLGNDEIAKEKGTLVVQ
ncbi:MAG: hypothetical protein WCW16_03885 [Candidatus Magasanikbacteria bacterium]